MHVEKNPFYPKNFLTIGDNTAKVNCYAILYYLYNKTRQSYMFPMAGQTAGPIRLKFLQRDPCKTVKYEDDI